jgi:hypothetical protein
MNKMRYIFGIICCSVLIASLCSSCSDDFFDATTDDRISPDQHYNTKTDADISQLGCYALLANVAEGMVLVDGLQSDQLDVTANADNDMIAINRHEVMGSTSYLDPSDFYKIVMNVNEVLPNLEKILGKDRDFDSVAFRAAQGSLVTLRSWSYYTLFKLYGNVSIMPTDVHSLDISKPLITFGPSQKAELIDALVAELIPFYDTLDINRYPIDLYALIGEMYLDKGDYPEAVKYLKISLDGPHYDKTGLKGEYMMLTTKSDKEDWAKIFVEPLNNQFIEENEGVDYNLTARTFVPYSIEAGHKNNIEEWMHINFNYMVKPTSAVVDSFNTQRPSAGTAIGDLYRGNKVSFNTSATGEVYVNKYSLPTQYLNSADVIIYRDADLQLMLAEALNRDGKTDVALVLLNAGVKNATPRPGGFIAAMWKNNLGVRGRVILKPNVVPAAIVSGDPTLYVEFVEDLIMNERALELAFEGHRWDDLVRVANRRGNPAYLADKVASKFNDPSVADAVKQKLMNPANWYLPLP